MALEQSPTWIERVEKSKQRDELYTAVQFLLNCFGSSHYLEMTESLCFVLEDLKTFLLGMNSSSRLEAFSRVPSTIMDEFGFLTLNTPAKLDLTVVTKDELLLLFVVFHLSLNGKSHFEEIVKDLKNRAPPIISATLSSASVADKIGYFRKYPQLMRECDSGHLELPNTFHLIFEDSSDDSESYEMDQSSQPETEDSDSVEIGSSPSIKKEFASVDSNKSSCLTQKEFISKRIQSSIFYVQQFFKLKSHAKFMRVILRVLEDVEIYFSYSSCADKVDLIQNSFVSNISKDPQPVVLSASTSDEVVSFLNRQEQEQLYFCFSIVIHGKMRCSKLFDNFFGRSKCTSDSEKLSYLKKYKHSLSINEKNIVVLRVLPDLHLHGSFMPYIFKSYATATTNETLQSQDIWFKDNLIYKRLCSFIHFLLHSFRTQPCDFIKKCILYVFPDIGIFLDELSREQQQEFFSCVPWTVLKSDNYLKLTSAYQFDTTYASQIKLCDLYIVTSLALNGETHGMKLIENLYISVPQVNFCNFASYKDQRWRDYLNVSNMWECDSSLYLTLPSSFYVAADNPDVVSQGASNKVAPLLVSKKELESLGLPPDILDILAERMVDCIAYLLKFFQLNIFSRFLEVVLRFIKRGSAFFKLPPPHQKEVIRKCFLAFRIDEQGNVTSTRTKGMQTYTVGVNSKLTICLSYIISNFGSMHYREAFIYYRNMVGWPTVRHDGKQIEFFRNRKRFFQICYSGNVSLADTIETIEFDYVSTLTSRDSANQKPIKIKKEDTNSD